MMIADKERLSVIGKLIGVYREERRHNTQNNYTQKTFCSGICTVNTLKKVEAGELSRSQDVYVELLQKFDLEFNYFPEVDRAIKLLMDKLYDAIEFYRVDEIIKLSTKAIRLLSKIKDYVYYSELYSLMEATRRYYEEDIEISVSTMYRFIAIYEIIDPVYIDLFKRHIFLRAQIISVHNLNTYCEIVNNLNLKSSSYLATRLLELQYYYILNQYETMKELLEELEPLFWKEKNYVKVIDVYNFAIPLYSIIESDKRTEYIEKMEELINSYNIPDTKIAEVYSKIGTTLFCEGKYEEAIEYFEKMLHFDKSSYLSYVLFLASCQSHVDKKVTIPEIDSKFLGKYSREMQIMYNFFYYYDVAPIVRQSAIMNDIAPFLVDDDLINIFRFELKKVLKETSSYKYLFMFEEMIEENMNKMK